MELASIVRMDSETVVNSEYIFVYSVLSVAALVILSDCYYLNKLVYSLEELALACLILLWIK